MIVGLCKEGKSKEAVELFKNMEENSMNPDRNIYLSLINTLCKNSKVETALEFFDLIKVKGFEPDIKTYKVLISALCKERQVSKARVLFEDMLDRQWDTDEIVWTVLIDGVFKDADVDTCLCFIHIMELKNRVPNFQTYVMLAKELSAVDGSCDIHEVVERLKLCRGKTIS